MLARARRRLAPAPTAQAYHLPAPTGGLNTVSAGMAMPASDAVLAVNLISAENGLRARLGYSEWCTGLEGATTDAVRTVMSFAGSVLGSNRLFATTEQGIYDVSSSSTTPTLVYSFATQVGNAGWGSWAVMVTAAGHFLLYCDEVNGLHVYSESGGTWAAVTQGGGATQINGVDPSDLVFVAVFKQRVWLVQRDTASAWYLPTGAIYGAATEFPMGRAFRAGGHLVGLWNCTYDGGAGMDDSLVAISGGGDVLVWQGTDPASAFGLKGVWQIGQPPAGRRIASTFGGDVLLLSRAGLLPLSRLVVGGTGPEEYATAKVGNYLNSLMLEKADTLGWAMALNPQDANALMLLIPTGSSDTDLQLVQAAGSRGWFLYRDLPMLSAVPHEGTLYFGTADGRVCRHVNYLDGVTLADPSAYEPVDCSLISAFSTLGSPTHKQVQMLRPLFVATDSQVSYNIGARYDYDLDELDTATLSLGGAGTWDTAVWDTDVWGGSQYALLEPNGAVGEGVHVAVALRFSSIGRTVLVGVDVSYTSGGLL